MSLSHSAEQLIDLALEEDVGTGDVTTKNLIPSQAKGQGAIVAKENLIISGLDVAQRVFQRIDADVVFQSDFTDGSRVEKGQTVVNLSGRMGALLTGERTALNFLQRLSGIATYVQTYVSVLEDRKVKYNDVTNSEFIGFLESRLAPTWGFWGRLLGRKKTF